MLIEIVGVVYTEAFEGTEARLNCIKPAGIVGRQQLDVVVSSGLPEVFVPVKGQSDEILPMTKGLSANWLIST